MPAKNFSGDTGRWLSFFFECRVRAMQYIGVEDWSVTSTLHNNPGLGAAQRSLTLFESAE